MEIAKEILRQLGGHRFIAMTGAKSFAGTENSLSFRIPRSNGVQYVEIVLTPSDDYTIEFSSIRKFEKKVLNRVEGIYCDQLQDIFTENTGLYTHL